MRVVTEIIEVPHEPIGKLVTPGAGSFLHRRLQQPSNMIRSIH